MAARRKAMRVRGWLSPVQAAAMAKVDRATIYRWISDDRLKITKVAGSRYVSLASLRKLLGPMMVGRIRMPR